MTIISWCQPFWQEYKGPKQRCIDCFLPFFLFEPQENWIPNGRTPNSHLQALQGGHISRPSGPKKINLYYPYIVHPGLFLRILLALSKRENFSPIWSKCPEKYFRLQNYFKICQMLFHKSTALLFKCCPLFALISLTNNSENKESSHFVRNGSIGDNCYCQAKQSIMRKQFLK